MFAVLPPENDNDVGCRNSLRQAVGDSERCHGLGLTITTGKRLPESVDRSLGVADGGGEKDGARPRSPSEQEKKVVER